MKLYPEKQFSAYSSIVLHPGGKGYQGAMMLWYYLRSLDEKGRGLLKLSIKQIAEDFDKAEATIERYIKDGLRFGFFRNVVHKKEDDTHRFYMRGLFRVANRLGIRKELGACFMLARRELRGIKFRATEAVAAELQYQSRQQAFASLKMFDPRIVAESDTLTSAFSLRQKSEAEVEDALPVKPITKSLKGTSVFRITQKRVFVGHQYITYGGSQQTIAARSHCSKRTVQRRLSNTERSKREIESLPKVQVFKMVDHQEVHIRCMKMNRTNFVYEELQDGSIRKVLNFGGTAFEPLTNIYNSNLELRSNRLQRFKFDLFCKGLSLFQYKQMIKRNRVRG